MMLTLDEAADRLALNRWVDDGGPAHLHPDEPCDLAHESTPLKRADSDRDQSNPRRA
jgi:hypothetical protein